MKREVPVRSLSINGVTSYKVCAPTPNGSERSKLHIIFFIVVIIYLIVDIKLYTHMFHHLPLPPPPREPPEREPPEEPLREPPPKLELLRELEPRL